MRKLNLKKVTLRTLTARQLDNVGGGYPRTYVPNTDACPAGVSGQCVATLDLCGAS